MCSEPCARREVAMIPFEELAASGIDRVTAERLNYRCTPDGGWEIPYLDP